MSLICPAYQDEDNIGNVVSKALTVLPGVVKRFEIVVVDDGSRDGTAGRVLQLAKRDERVRLVRHARNMGYGQALRTGLESASPMEILCLSDGDGQYDVAELARMLPFMEEYDVVTGARRANRNPLHRRMMSYGFNSVIRLLFRVTFRDLTSSLKMFRREACLQRSLVSRGNFTDVELVLRSHFSGFSVKEITIEHYPTQFGRSYSMSIKRILETFSEMWRVYRALKSG